MAGRGANVSWPGVGEEDAGYWVITGVAKYVWVRFGKGPGRGRGWARRWVGWSSKEACKMMDDLRRFRVDPVLMGQGAEAGFWRAVVGEGPLVAARWCEDLARQVAWMDAALLRPGLPKRMRWIRREWAHMLRPKAAQAIRVLCEAYGGRALLEEVFLAATVLDS